MSTTDDRMMDLFTFFERERAVVDRLHNWGAWSKDRMRYMTAFSAEGKYRSPQNDDDRMPQTRVDMIDAQSVQSLLAPGSGEPIMSKTLMMLLHGWFVHERRSELSLIGFTRSRQCTVDRLTSLAKLKSAVMIARSRIVV